MTGRSCLTNRDCAPRVIGPVRNRVERVVEFADEMELVVLTERDVVAHLERTQPAARHGWFWEAFRTEVPGWFRVQYRGPGTYDVPLGVRHFVGPGFAFLALSTDPDLHHPAVTIEVLSELGAGPVDVHELSFEIFDRTKRTTS